MSDDLDVRLHEYAERWRDTVELSRPDLSNLGAPRRRLVLPAVVAAAVAAIIVGIGVTRLGGEDSSTPPIDDPPVVVPWAALDPTSPTIPTQTVPLERDPAAAAAAPPCGAGDVVAERLGDEEAVRTYVLRAADGDTSCRLEGSPEVALLTDERPVDVPVRRARGEPEPVLVTVGLSARITFFWGPTACFAPPVIEVIDIALADGAIAVEGFGAEPCLRQMSSTAVSPVQVGEFLPYETERTVSDYDGLVARLVSEPVRRGDVVSFTVEVTATEQDVRLDPCPDHSLLHRYSFDDLSGAGHALNCAGVPFRDADGVPYLPLDVPVQFAMEWDLHSVDNAEGVEWRLDVPHNVVLELPSRLG